MAKTKKAGPSPTPTGLASADRPTARMIPAAPLPAPPTSEPPVPHGPRPIKVRATVLCYYDHARRREGDVFFLARREDFNEKCMELVDARTPERTTGAGAALQQQHDEILAGRTPGMSGDEPHI